MARRGVLLLTCLLLSAAATWAEVIITPGDQGFTIKADQYEATVGSDSCLTSLKVQGEEYFLTQGGFPRGGYPYQGGILAVNGMAAEGPGKLRAEDEKAAMTYEFTATGLTLTFTNKTDKTMTFVIVFQKEVTAVQPEGNRYRKTPTEAHCRVATFFRLPAKLKISAPQRIWGPWGDGYQVLTSDVAPQQTGRIAFEAGLTTPPEKQKVEAAMNRVLQPPTDPIGPMWDLQRFGKAPACRDAPQIKAEGAPGVRGLFFDGPPLEGEPTAVFAWVGIPAHNPGEKLPGMVLIHGGGGTAFANWVKLWNDRGYAAIAMDTCGCVPVGTYSAWERHPQGGPAGWGGFGQIDWPREDQWTFHAVASALLAHSLLRSLPEVDPERTGVTGISWGGYLTSLVAGVDPRFKLAVPIYGCGYTLDMTFGSNVRALKPEGQERWMRWWDPSAYLKQARMPILWMNGTNDFAYTMNGWQKSYRDPQGPRTLSLKIRMPHGHGPAGEGPEEIHAFANQILKGGVPLCQVTGQGREGDGVWATFVAQSPVVKAELCFTKDTGEWPEKNWEALPAELTPGKASAKLPEGTKCYYLNLTDERGLIVSSEHEELP